MDLSLGQGAGYEQLETMNNLAICKLHLATLITSDELIIVRG